MRGSFHCHPKLSVSFSGLFFVLASIDQILIHLISPEVNIIFMFVGEDATNPLDRIENYIVVKMNSNSCFEYKGWR